MDAFQRALVSCAPPLRSSHYFLRSEGRNVHTALSAVWTFYLPISSSSSGWLSKWPKTADSAAPWGAAIRSSLRKWRRAERLQHVGNLLSQNRRLLQQWWDLLQLWRLLD